MFSSGRQLAVEVKKEAFLPWSVGFADHETVDFHNFHMAQRWDHSAYYPPVTFPCLDSSSSSDSNGTDMEMNVWRMKLTKRTFHEDLFLRFCPRHDIRRESARH